MNDEDQPTATHHHNDVDEGALTQAPRDGEHDEEVELTRTEEDQVEERKSVGSRVVHEVIRRQGDEELKRPAISLMWSGFAAGFAISASILGEGLIEEMLPDRPWRPLVASFGYTLGFLVVVLSRLQLFTESTLSAVIPVATHPTPINLARIARLWGIVFLSNMAGTFVIALLTSYNLIGLQEHVPAMLEVARKAMDHPPTAILTAGVPAGFLIAAVAWTLPMGRGQEFWIVLVFTYFIGLGGFSHVVAGSGEAWMLVLNGDMSFGQAIGGFILPALAGNILGGTMLFALLAHAQVRHEL
jgi:formate/nitrite transporter FocA (FNT family)